MHPPVRSAGLGRFAKCKAAPLLKACLAPLRRLVRAHDEADDRRWLRARSKREPGKEESGVLPEHQRIPATTRTHLRKSRHDSQQSPLPSIPETEGDDDEADDDEAIEPLSLPQARPSRATLLDVPPELRNQIYRLVFGDWQCANGLALLQTCRQIHGEAANLAFAHTLFRIHTEHWPDHDFFLARYTSLLAPARLASVRHLALRLPRGAPYDCYASRRLHVNLAGLGLRLRSLLIFSHYPRPLPRVSEHGGVMEMDLCRWLVDTLYAMPSLEELRIVNYESAAPGLFDIPSPRLVRLLRGQIFRDVMAERQSLAEGEFQWHCRCERDRAYAVFSRRLARLVSIVFETADAMPGLGLGRLHELRLHLDPDELLRAVPPDVSPASYAALLAARGASGNARKRLSKTLSGARQRHSSRRGSVSHVLEHLVERGVAEPCVAAAPRKRLSKRYSLQSPPQPSAQPRQESPEQRAQRDRRHRQSWHGGQASNVAA